MSFETPLVLDVSRRSEKDRSLRAAERYEWDRALCELRIRQLTERRERARRRWRRALERAGRFRPVLPIDGSVGGSSRRRR